MHMGVAAHKEESVGGVVTQKVPSTLGGVGCEVGSGGKRSNSTAEQAGKGACGVGALRVFRRTPWTGDVPHHKGGHGAGSGRVNACAISCLGVCKYGGR
jgi:hypothetical protein